MTGHVFISYSHRQDGAYVDRLAAHLTAAGLPVWYDREIVSSHRWDRVIQEKIDTCAAFVVVMTPQAYESEWVSREIIQAQSRARPIFPLLLRGDRFFALANIQSEDVTGGRLPSPQFLAQLRALADGRPPQMGALPLGQPVRPAPPQAPPQRSKRARPLLWAAVAVSLVAALGIACLGPGLSFVGTMIGQFPDLGRNSPAPSPSTPGQIVVRASGKAPWTVRGYGYEFSVTRITHATGPFGPNEGKPCLLVVASVERFAAEDHRSMRLVVIDDKHRILGADPFSGKGSLEPPLHQKTQFETVVVVQGTGAATLTFTVRGAFWPDGQDLILEGVPVPR
ncbi:hypothetical protein F4553_005602 [Allocatelliglobosispora scoriae]|uniref:TIR domain-containing protein n=1 Tax=Allocatelliglobosispora scoriae TaxID=643052 RepID=A0A841BXE3_9ACTN|nr:toll/interleukin-1 receptor domain-containing protein [Allocatelliglobosispora scoriae]MBB5872168.1 hypothetical protein [Allocatelliglobosispora scoriae]